MNIIVSRTDKIGDLVLSIPSFFMIKKMYPESKLTVLVRNYNYDVVKNLPYIDKVIKIDDYSDLELLEEVAKLKADIFIALFTDKFVGRIARASKAKLRVGPYSKLHSYFTYNKGVFQKRSKSIKNEAEYNLDLIKSIDSRLFDEKFEIDTKIYYEETHKSFIENFLSEKQIKSFILIHPFSGGSAKNITDTQYVELIERIATNTPDKSIILSSSFADKERAEKISANCKNEVTTFVNEGSLLNLVALIDKADVFIGTSTGPTHLAGALGKKIIAIYPIKKTQSTLRWGVYGNNNMVEYILPEGEIEEDYSTKDFLSWGEKDIKKILDILRSV